MQVPPRPSPPEAECRSAKEPLVDCGPVEEHEAGGGLAEEKDAGTGRAMETEAASRPSEEPESEHLKFQVGAAEAPQAVPEAAARPAGDMEPKAEAGPD